MHEGDGFSAKTVGKNLFHCKNAAPAMVWPASSDFWKAPLVYATLLTLLPGKNTKHYVFSKLIILNFGGKFPPTIFIEQGD